MTEKTKRKNNPNRRWIELSVDGRDDLEDMFRRPWHVHLWGFFIVWLAIIINLVLTSIVGHDFATTPTNGNALFVVGQGLFIALVGIGFQVVGVLRVHGGIRLWHFLVLLLMWGGLGITIYNGVRSNLFGFPLNPFLSSLDDHYASLHPSLLSFIELSQGMAFLPTPFIAIGMGFCVSWIITPSTYTR
ncbi:MAG: hypothetical protein AAFR81_10780 [Chloroflexota bacterium]